MEYLTIIIINVGVYIRVFVDMIFCNKLNCEVDVHIELLREIFNDGY